MAESRGKNKNLVEAGNPRLLKKLVKNDTEYSLYLEYQMGYNRDNGTSIRKKESLSLYLLASPRTPIQRQQNKETLELAKKIRFEREQEFLDNREGYRLKKEKGINFLDYYQSYISNYSKKDIRMIQIALNRFKDFLSEYHPLLKDFIRPDAITHEMMVKFAEYLQTRSVGEGAKSILQRFKKVVRSAVDQGIMAKDPCKGVVCVVDDQVLKKDVLSQEEIKNSWTPTISSRKRMSVMPSSSASIQVCVSAMSKTCATRTLTMLTNSCVSSKTRPKDTLPVVGSPSPSMTDSSVWSAGQKKERQRNRSFSTSHHTKAAVSPLNGG